MIDMVIQSLIVEIIVSIYGTLLLFGNEWSMILSLVVMSLLKKLEIGIIEVLFPIHEKNF